MINHYATFSPRIERDGVPAHVMTVGFNVYPQPNRTSPHVHPDATEIVFLHSGEGDIHIGDRKLAAATGDLVVYGPGVRHMEDWYISQDALILLYVKLDRGVFPPGDLEGCSAVEKMPVLPTGIYQSQISRLLWTMNREWTCDQTDREMISEHLADSLLLLIRRLYAERFAQLAREDESLSEQVRKYLARQYAQSITLESLAQRFHVSAYHLSHLFKKDVGVSPIRYMNQARIDQAKMMIRTSTYSVREIVARTGFENAPNFNHMFKKYTGMTPTAYKRAESELLGQTALAAKKEET